MNEEKIREIFVEELEKRGYVFSKNIQILDTRNIQLGRGTGTKLGTETGQKLGLFNATPVSQQTTKGTNLGFLAGGGSAVDHLATFTGNLGASAYNISDIVLALKNLGILAQ